MFEDDASSVLSLVPSASFSSASIFFATSTFLLTFSSPPFCPSAFSYLAGFLILISIFLASAGNAIVCLTLSFFFVAAFFGGDLLLNLFLLPLFGLSPLLSSIRRSFFTSLFAPLISLVKGKMGTFWLVSCFVLNLPSLSLSDSSSEKRASILWSSTMASSPSNRASSSISSPSSSSSSICSSTAAVASSFFGSSASSRTLSLITPSVIVISLRSNFFLRASRTGSSPSCFFSSLGLLRSFLLLSSSVSVLFDLRPSLPWIDDAFLGEFTLGGRTLRTGDGDSERRFGDFDGRLGDSDNLNKKFSGNAFNFDHHNRPVTFSATWTS
jgi:hypothetical protein